MFFSIAFPNCNQRIQFLECLEIFFQLVKIQSSRNLQMLDLALSLSGLSHSHNYLYYLDLLISFLVVPFT